MPASTEAYYILHSDYRRWGAETGAPVGSAVTVTYSFSTQQSSETSQYGNFTPFNATQIAATKSALAYISSFTKITFVETTANDGKLQFSNADLTPFGAGGVAPHSYYNAPGGFAFAHVLMNNTGETRLDDKAYIPGEISATGKGGSAWQTLIHEIGHTLGLKHPHDRNDAGDPNSAMPASIDNLTQSTMSYAGYGPSEVTYITPGQGGTTGKLLPSTFQMSDIAALQYLYGVNTSSTGNKVFSFDPNTPVYMTISDNGPNNTIDVSALTGRNTINLTPGTFSDLAIKQQVSYADAGKMYDGSHALAIATGVLVANVNGGSGADHITGNGIGNVLRGNGGSDTIYGGGGNDSILGGLANDRLFGDAGFDSLAGGAGADELNGGAGTDYAAYDDADWGNLLIRLDASRLNTGAAAGDTYISIEGVIGGVGNDTIFGTTASDSLIGGAGNDSLNGGSGNDSLNGGDGNDRLVGGDGADRLVGGVGGVDQAAYSDTVNMIINLADSSRNTGTAAGDTYISIEGVIGGSGNDAITGDIMRNFLNGGLGDDTIDGGLGNDVLTGVGGADRFRFSTALTKNVDSISDFVHGTDKIELSQAIFVGVGVTLDANEFGAADPDTLIVYNQSTGQLSYDGSGAGKGAAPVVFATVTAGTVLDLNDFIMIA